MNYKDCQISFEFVARGGDFSLEDSSLLHTEPLKQRTLRTHPSGLCPGKAVELSANQITHLSYEPPLHSLLVHSPHMGRARGSVHTASAIGVAVSNGQVTSPLPVPLCSHCMTLF